MEEVCDDFLSVNFRNRGRLPSWPALLAVLAEHCLDAGGKVRAAVALCVPEISKRLSIVRMKLTQNKNDSCSSMFRASSSFRFLPLRIASKETVKLVGLRSFRAASVFFAHSCTTGEACDVLVSRSAKISSTVLCLKTLSIAMRTSLARVGVVSSA